MKEMTLEDLEAVRMQMVQELESLEKLFNIVFPEQAEHECEGEGENCDE